MIRNLVENHWLWLCKWFFYNANRSSVDLNDLGLFNLWYNKILSSPVLMGSLSQKLFERRVNLTMSYD